MKRKLVFFLLLVASVASAQVRIAQLSDLHIGAPAATAPHAVDNLRQAVQIINAQGVDAVIVTGDIGENPTAWANARSILGQLKAKVYYVPGNHDIHSNDFDRYRGVFGQDFYRVQVKNVLIYGFDSSVFGNYDSYDAAKLALPPPSQQAAQNKTQMLNWMRSSATPPPPAGTVVIGMQHIPIAIDNKVLTDRRPYWAIPAAEQTNEVNLLKSLGIHHMFVGHWHYRDQFSFGGITWHAGTSTGRLIHDKLGFDIHTISATGDVSSVFFPLGN
jgi:3',5'-cyclic AMP phosphodiesterase CpdA